MNALAVHLGSLADRRKTLVVVDRRDRPRRAAARSGVPADARYGHSIGEPRERRRSTRSTRAAAPTTPAREALRRARERNRRRGDRRRSGRRAAARRRRLEPRTTCCRSAPRTPTMAGSATLQVRVDASRRPRCARRKGYWAASPDEALRTALLTPDQRAEAGRAAGAGAARQHAHPAVVRGLARSRVARHG